MQLKFVLAAVLGLAVGANASLNKKSPELKLLWNTWKQVHSKTYTQAEEAKRFGIFSENYFKIVSHNAKKSTYKKGLNQFSDLTGAEFKQQYATGYKATKTHKSAHKSTKVHKVADPLPASVDWRDQGAVTPVRDEGQCGSCWAFSAVGALEGLNFINSGELVALSEQQLIDCENPDQGCNGGLMNNAFVYTAQEGIESDADYPYTGITGTCQYDATKAINVNSGFVDVQTNDVDSLKTALVQQPVSVAIEADQDIFQTYVNGVITEGCGASLDFAALAVGYTQDAFIVKNSWSETWGDSGYVYISTDGSANNGAGVCGILSLASYPV